ncbi:MAG: DUF1957 domain-containing protein [Armatimonadetes bacterium]|nr:DUF1957 domain-containing protein [Armatimonadota bacterium]
MEKGYVALVLHAHLPYVRHPEYTDSFEEDWLYEAITETYIPLLKVFYGLIRDGVDFRITMSLTPTLMEMLADPLLQDRYVKEIEKLIELAEKEVERTKNIPEFHPIAQMYLQHFLDSREIFVDRYHRNLVTAFREVQERGFLEIITCCATHGFLPLMQVNREASVRAQVHVGAQNYRKHMGRSPRGIWLPECGYDPGDDRFLADEGIQFFFVDTHGIMHAEPRPLYGVFSPLQCPTGVHAFGRDLESSKQVWSADEGYPGDFYYREFYKDIGYDLPEEYIGPYVHESGIRQNTGIKYYRITGKNIDLGQKAPYMPGTAAERAATHAGNFMWCREKQSEHLYGLFGGRRPIIVCPYDAELFGHWWFEGPQWIDFLFRKIHHDQDTIRLITPPEYLEQQDNVQAATPSMSSWGYKGYHEVWLEGSNDWVYRHLHRAVEKMTELANRFPECDGLHWRALNQAARELLLAQSSDWAFIMKTGTHVEYATKRTKEHLIHFNWLYDQVMGGEIHESWLSEIEGKDNLFSEIDYRVYRT